MPDEQARTIRLALPARCADAQAAIEKWLLALWQSSPNSWFPILPRRAPISLEYLAAYDQVFLQAHLALPLVETSRALLPAFFPGIDIEPADAETIPVRSSEMNRVVCDFRLRAPGWVNLKKEADPDSTHGVVQ